MGFPFKLLDVAALGIVFFILFPLCPDCYSPGIEFLRAYTKLAELVYACMGIRGNDTHMFSSVGPHAMAAVPASHMPLPPPPLPPSPSLGYSEESLKKITKTHFGMTEVHATTGRGCFSHREAAPAACKLTSPRSPSHDQVGVLF